MSTQYPKKLIEVALPLPEINDASSYDKMPGIGPHPKGIHHWWARLPLPSARAVLFASVVTDPEDDPAWKNKSAEEQDVERERLFGIVRRLMGKKLHEQPAVYEEARKEMLRHCDGKLPPVLDPFSGGGSIPLEAARLGFEAHAADLNPVAVLLNKCNLELAPRWAGRPPVNPDDRTSHHKSHVWKGTHGLAADVRYYGRLIRARAQEKIGHLYPKVRLPKEHGGGEANVIAWLWARTVASQDPAAKGAHVPLITSYWLANNGAKSAWLEPVVDRAARTYRFEVKTGTPTDKAAVRAGTKAGRRTFRCLLSGEPLEYNYTRAQAKAQKLGCVLTCIVAETKRGRIYLPADVEHEKLGRTNEAKWKPEELVTTPCHDVDRLPMYGMPEWGDAFTPRQLTALTTLTDLVKAVRADIVADAQRAGFDSTDADAYVRTVCTFLALAVDRTADFNAAVCSWNNSNQKVMHVFGRQAIPMNWDFGEANTLGDSVGAWSTCCDYVADCVEVLSAGNTHRGKAAQVDAANGASGVDSLMVSTDPPYYDNIGYAALSDFFYVWLRRSVGDLYPDIFSTMLVPKTRELTASPERFDGDKEKAKEHFESGFRHAFSKLRDRLDARFPLTVYYAFKQEDDDEGGGDEEGEASGGVDLTTGWETLLEALIWTDPETESPRRGFTITATWPVRASQKWRMVAMGTSSLASYIVLACRPRPLDAPRVGRNAFVAELKRELAPALRHLQQGNVAPVDFAQAAIGPGMAVFSRYSAVLESNGKPMSIRTALALINGLKDELLGESVEELDRDTRWAVTWYDESGFDWGEAGQAHLLANAQATAVNGLQAAGIVEVKGNQVRLLRAEEMPADWDPRDDVRLTMWEMTHHLLRVYYHERKGDEATAALLRKLGSKADVARDLAYKLFTVAENKKRSADAQAYNALVLGWPELAKLAQGLPAEPTITQAKLL
jgi:putative DNA methylase